MKILVISHFHNDGSATASFVEEQIRAIKRAGHSVQVICPVAFGKKDYLGKRFSHTQVEVDGVEHRYLRYLSLSKYGEKFFNNASAILMLRLRYGKLFSQNFDVIHAHTIGLDSSLGRVIKAKEQKPLVVTIHGSDLTVPLSKGFDASIKSLSQDIDVIVCVSSKLKNILGNTQSKVVVILNGFETTTSSIAEKEIQHKIVSFPTDGIRVNQTSALINQKNIDKTIEAISLLRKDYPQIHLDIVGGGEKESELKSLCKDLKLDDVVEFTGQLSHDDVIKKMKEAQFFVMPSENEGFGIVYLEALSQGCITIGKKGEGIEDLIETGKNGILVEPTPQAIAEQIKWCIENRNESIQIARKGYEDSHNHTWDNNVKEHFEIYRGLLNR